MNKTLKCLVLCTVVLIILCAIGALLYFVPFTAQIDLTLNTIKLDKDGNAIGTAEIHLEGQRWDYLFQEDRIYLEIDPFDNYKNIVTRSDGEYNIVDRFGKEYYGKDYKIIRFDGWDKEAAVPAMGFIYFDENFDCFAFMGNSLQDDEYYYIASVSGAYTTEELIAFFNGLVPGL